MSLKSIPFSYQVQSKNTWLSSRLTVVSRGAKKKQAYTTNHKLFTCSTAVKLANVLNKQPLKLSLKLSMIQHVLTM